MAIDSGVDELRRPDSCGGVDRIEGTKQDRDPAGLGKFNKAGAQLKATGDDQPPNALLDGRKLDGWPVTTDHNDTVSIKLLHPGCEAVGTHGTDHDKQFVSSLRLDSVLKGTAQRSCDLLQVCRYCSRLDGVTLIAKEQFHQVEHR